MEDHGEIDKRRRITERDSGKEEDKIDKRWRISDRGSGERRRENRDRRISERDS